MNNEDEEMNINDASKYLEDLKEAFRVIDTDNNGLINLKELGTAMRAFGFELNDIELQDLMKEYDKDGNNSLDLSEFIDLMNKKREEQKEEKDHFETFQLLDINDDGYLSIKNLKLLFENIGLDVDDEMLDGFFQYADKDNDKKLFKYIILNN